MSKRKDREKAFQIIFEKSINGNDISEIVNLARESRDEEGNENAIQKAQLVFDNIEEIDAAIDRNLKGWNKQRVSKISLALMRLAAYEILFDDELDCAISLNEAVLLAKKYSTQEEASFINGVLASIAREVK